MWRFTVNRESTFCVPHLRGADFEHRPARPDPPAESVSGLGADAAGEPHVASGAQDGHRREAGIRLRGVRGRGRSRPARAGDPSRRLRAPRRGQPAEKADRNEEAGRIREELSRSRRGNLRLATDWFLTADAFSHPARVHCDSRPGATGCGRIGPTPGWHPGPDGSLRLQTRNRKL